MAKLESKKHATLLLHGHCDCHHDSGHYHHHLTGCNTLKCSKMYCFLPTCNQGNCSLNKLLTSLLLCGRASSNFLCPTPRNNNKLITNNNCVHTLCQVWPVLSQPSKQYCWSYIMWLMCFSEASKDPWLQPGGVGPSVHAPTSLLACSPLQPHLPVSPSLLFMLQLLEPLPGLELAILFHASGILMFFIFAHKSLS